jgi:Family of unknown function (DUF6445)
MHYDPTRPQPVVATVSAGNLHIVDNFYDNPIEVRALALQSNYEGPPRLIASQPQLGGSAWRSNCPLEVEREACSKLEKILGIRIESNTFQFRYTLGSSSKRAVCHVDRSQYTAVMYLTRPEHCQGGTSLFRHIPSNRYEAELEEPFDYSNPDSWEEIYRVEMKFNRMVVYPGRLFHSPTPPFFGDTIENARLSQTMFINPGP